MIATIRESARRSGLPLATLSGAEVGGARFGAEASSSSDRRGLTRGACRHTQGTTTPPPPS
eukprot:1856993-Lingulodinium_polyedra.AAC.1